MPACEARTYPTIAKYRHFSCYRLPPTAVPPKNEIPPTVKILPSRCTTAEILPAHFGFTVSVKVVTVQQRNTDYRQQNYRQVVVPPGLRPPKISLPNTTLEKCGFRREWCCAQTYVKVGAGAPHVGIGKTKKNANKKNAYNREDNGVVDRRQKNENKT